MAARRTDRSGRTALLGCGAALAMLAGLVGLGLVAYIGGIVAVRTSSGFHAAMAAIEAHETTEPRLGLPLSHSVWLGLQLARSDADHLELRVRSTSTGALGSATVYSTFAFTEEGLDPTSVLLTATDGVIDVLARNAEASQARVEDRQSTLLDEARALHDSKRHAEALVLADQAVALDPDNAAARAVRAHIRLALTDRKGAEADAREALVLDPDHPHGLRALARVHHAWEDWPECIDVATIRIRASPRDGAAWAVRSACFLGAGKRREAAAGAREACELGSAEGCALAQRLE